VLECCLRCRARARGAHRGVHLEPGDDELARPRAQEVDGRGGQAALGRHAQSLRGDGLLRNLAAGCSRVPGRAEGLLDLHLFRRGVGGQAREAGTEKVGRRRACSCDRRSDFARQYFVRGLLSWGSERIGGVVAARSRARRNRREFTLGVAHLVQPE